MDNGSMTEAGVTYRLPDWLGGHPVHIDGVHDDGTVRVWVTDRESTTIEIHRSKLIEVKPPSIDDPERIPFDFWDSETDRKLMVLSDDADGAILSISLREEHLFKPVGVFNYRRAEIPLAAPTMRRIARALWQRANAVEAGEQS